YEYAALPDVERIVSAIQRSFQTRQERVAVAAGVDRGTPIAEPALVPPGSSTPATVETGKERMQRITVPVMGEGIRNAKVVSLLKNPGDTIALDDELCEVETDKAVYPIQSSFAGVMGEWKTKIGDTVDIGQELGTLFTDEESLADQFEVAAEVSEKRKPVEAAASAARPGDGDRAQHATRNSIETALSPTVPRKYTHVIPATPQ